MLSYFWKITYPKITTWEDGFIGIGYFGLLVSFIFKEIYI